MKPTFLLALFGGFSFSNTIGVNTNARILGYCYNHDQNIFKLSSLSLSETNHFEGQLTSLPQEENSPNLVHI